MRCTAKAKSTGERCRRSAKAGFEVCRVHGANRGTPGNTHAVKHGAYGTLMRERLSENERAAFDAVSVEPALADELRILRFKLLMLVGDVDQNVHGKDATWKVKADAFEKARGIGYLAGEIRKLVKDMNEVGEADPLLEEIAREWEAGMRSEGKLGAESQPEAGEVLP